MGTIPDPANVHAGAQTNMLQRGKRLDFALVVNVPGGFGHN
jgi:hypothetical protein